MAQKTSSQDNRVLGLAGIMLAFLALSMNLLPMTGGPAAGVTTGNTDNESLPTPCQVGFFVTSVNETNTATNGTLVISCSQVGWTQLTGYPSGCSANQFVTAIGAVLTCSTVSYTGLTSFPTGCSAGQFVTGVGVTLTCSSVAWTQITSFPSGCASGQAVTVIGASLTCGNFCRNTDNPSYCDGIRVWANFEGALDTGWSYGCGATNATFVTGIVGQAMNLKSPSVTLCVISPQSFMTGLGQSIYIYAKGSVRMGLYDAVQNIFVGTVYDLSSGCSTTGSPAAVYVACNSGNPYSSFTGFMLTITTASSNKVEIALYAPSCAGCDATYDYVHSIGYFITGGASYQPLVVAKSSQTAKTATIASIFAYTQPGTSATLFIYQIGGDLDVTAYTSGTISLQVSYTDWNSAAQTVTLVSSSALGDFGANTLTILPKGATSVTCKTTGTFVLTYNVGCYLIMIGQ